MRNIIYLPGYQFNVILESKKKKNPYWKVIHFSLYHIPKKSSTDIYKWNEEKTFHYYHLLSFFFNKNSIY